MIWHLSLVRHKSFMKLPRDYMEGNLSTFGPGGVSAPPVVFQTWLPGMNLLLFSLPSPTLSFLPEIIMLWF